MYPGADGIVVARFHIPFININAKNETLKLKACITSQYLLVSSSQMTRDVRKTIRIVNGDRREASPSRNLCINALVC